MTKLTGEKVFLDRHDARVASLDQVASLDHESFILLLYRSAVC